MSKLNLIHFKNIQTESVKSLLVKDPVESEKFRVIGWVKSFRDQKEISFIHLNDGSHYQNLQLVISMDKFEENLDTIKDTLGKLNFNTSIKVTGELLASTHKKQKVELHVDDIKIINVCEPTDYPFQTKIKPSLEQIRPHIHLRPHTDIFSNILKFRSV